MFEVYYIENNKASDITRCYGKYFLSYLTEEARERFKVKKLSKEYVYPVETDEAHALFNSILDKTKIDKNELEYVLVLIKLRLMYTLHKLKRNVIKIVYDAPDIITLHFEEKDTSSLVNVCSLSIKFGSNGAIERVMEHIEQDIDISYKNNNNTVDLN